MDTTLKSAENAAPAPMRRTLVSIPIVIRGKDANGQSFHQDSRTIAVTPRGLLVEAIQQLWLGAEIQVENCQLRRTAVGRVVWWPSGSSLTRANEVGIYMPEAEEFCGISAEAPPAPEATAPASASLPPVSGVEAVDQAPTPAEAARAAPVEAEAGRAEPAESTADSVPLDAPAAENPTEPSTTELSSPAEEPVNVLVELPGAPPPLVSEDEVIETVAVEEERAAPPPAEESSESASGEARSSAPAAEEAGLEVPPAAAEDLTRRSAEIESRLAESLDRQAQAVEERLQSSQARAEAMLTKLEDLERQTQARLEASAATFERTVLASFEQQAAPLGERLARSRAEIERMLGDLAELEKRAAANAERAASQAEQKVMASLEQRLGSLGERVHTSRAQAEAVLARLDELQAASQAEIARVRQAIPEASGEALQFALDGVSQRVRAEVDAAGASVISETRERVRQEGTAAVRAFIESGELEVNVQRVLEGQGTAIFAQWQKDSDDFTGRQLARLCEKSDELVLATSRLLDQRATAAQESLASAVESSLAELRRAREQAMSAAGEAWAQTERHWVEEAGQRMRRLAEATLERMNETLAARQKSLVEDTAQALRARIVEILSRLEQP